MPRSEGKLSAALGAALLVLVAGCTSSGGSKAASSSTAVFAEQAGNAPNYIFPFVNATVNTVPNVRQLQYLLYRPLYWFGQRNSLSVNYSLSLADPPQWNSAHDTVTIKLKSYAWSNGTKLSPRNVAFWMGLADSEKQNSAYYISGQFPDNVKSVDYEDASNTVVMHLTSSVSTDWFLYSELAQITPLPIAWDLTASGTPGSCSSESPTAQAASCSKVYKYLAAQAQDQQSYTTSPLWTVVDGPFRLSQYSASGAMTFVPNPKYSGPVKAKLSQVRYVPFTNSDAEYAALQSGENISVGYIPQQDLPRKAASAPVGKNPLSPKYTIYTQSLWGFYYLLLNFDNPKVGPLLHQLYIRQALQSSVDQTEYITYAQNGYGFEQYGPVPSVPPNPFVDTKEPDNQLSFSVSRATQLLTSHGWTISRSGPATCTKPGTAADECGAGIAAKTKLQLTMLSFTDPVEEQETQQLVTDAAKSGIDIKLTTLPPKQMVAETAQCKATSAACSWEISNYGANDYPSGFPSGAETLETGAGLNVGSYSDARMNQEIKATITGSAAAFAPYEGYAASQVPVIWMPSQYLNIGEVASNLKGATPLSPLGNINPEDWSFGS